MKYHDDITHELWAEFFRQLKLLPKEERKLALFWLIVNEGPLYGIFFAVIIFYQPLFMDIYGCDIRDPFSLQKGWLLWAIIGVIFANSATFGTTFATKYFSKRWPQPKTKDSIGSPKLSIVLWFVMVALLLPPVVEEYAYGGYLMASTKWLATRIVVVIHLFIIADLHWNSEQVSHLFVGVLAFGLISAKTRNPMTAVAMHLLLLIVQFSSTFIPFMRGSFSGGIVLLHPAKEVSYRARSYRARSYRARSYRARRKKKLVGKH